MRKRILSTLLALCMVLGMLPGEAFAAESKMFAEPRVTGLTVSFEGGAPIDLLDEQPAISMPEGSKPVFTVTFDSIELLDKVFVTSTKDGETKYLEATLKGRQYVTDGYFDPNDTNYIPGSISVTYSKKTVKVNKNGNLGSTDINTLKTQLTAQGISSRSETTNADGTVTAEIVLGDLFGAMSDVYFEAAVSEFMAGAGIDQSELNKWLGVYQNLSQLSSYDLESADGEKFTLYLGDGKDFGDSDTYLVLVKDVTSNKYTKMLLSKAADKAGLGDIADTLSAANLASKVLLDYSAISKDTAALREEVNAHPTMTSQEKAEANAKITALDHDKKLFMMGMTVIPFFLNPVGVPVMISALIAGYSSIADYFWDYRIGMIQGCEPVENVFSGEGEHPGWTAITAQYLWDNGSKIKESGRYYLAEEEINGLTVLEGLNVTLCLHGHTLGGISIGKDTTLKICDCKYTEESDGTITGGVISSPIKIEGGNELSIDGGIIVGNYGHAITNNGGKLIINNGIIQAINGSAIYDTNGNVTINGGILTYDRGGCCIHVDNSNLTINGGKISGDPAIGNNPSISAKEDTILTICNGIIRGSIETRGPGEIKTAIVIGRESDIQIGDNTDLVFGVVPEVERAAGYTGDVMYYNAPQASGVKKAFEDVKKINFAKLTYFRFVASGASTGDDCEHEYKASITPPTCTSQGYTTYICGLCGKTYTDNYVSALGHSYGRWVIVQEATETRTGLRERSCVVCSDVQSETIPKLDPKPSEPVEKPSKPEKPAEKPAEPEAPVQPETPVQPQEPVVSMPVYDDVAPEAWYHEAAAYVASKGIMTGTSENNFSPDAQMTRAMIWTVLGRMDGADVSSASGAWYAGAQAWSMEKGISDGANPNGSITRQELVTMLWRYTGSPAASADLTVFADSADVADWAAGAVEWAVSSGIIQGSGNALNPGGTATRAEAAAILMRFCKSTQ